MNLEMKRLNGDTQGMIVQQKSEVITLHFPAYQKLSWVTHGVSTRFGGVSEGIYSSMNFKEDADDTIEHVRENYRRIAEVLQCEPEKMVRPSLVHGNAVHRVAIEDYGEGTIRETTLFDIDALITDDKGVTLTATFADCVPLFFVDPVHHAIGLAHSGWRGTVKRIGFETVKAMQEAYGSRPEDIIAAVGPCICKDCYEVGEEVYREFYTEFPTGLEEKSGIKTSDLAHTDENGRYQLDLRSANRRILLEAGILPEKIQISDICTCCNPKLLFSHRATAGKRGAIAAFLGIRDVL